MSENSVAILGDLTSLYAARKKHRKAINYNKMDDILKDLMGVSSWNTADFYTLYGRHNDSQTNFLKGLEDMGWEIHKKEPRDIPPNTNLVDYRFDIDIAYQLGLAVDNFDKILVISDSYQLLNAIRNLRDDDSKIEVNLAFFQDALDGRWFNEINENNLVNFINLDNKLYHR